MIGLNQKRCRIGEGLVPRKPLAWAMPCGLTTARPYILIESLGDLPDFGWLEKVDLDWVSIAPTFGFGSADETGTRACGLPTRYTRCKPAVPQALNLRPKLLLVRRIGKSTIE